MRTPPRAPTLLWFAICLLAGGCAKSEAPEAEPVVPVQTVRVQQSEMEQQVTAEALLFPLRQATIVPKIAAPVRRFLVVRGERVRAGQVLAELESNDLAAAVKEDQGAYQQAQANYDKTTASNLPEQIQKAEAAVTTETASLQAAQQQYDEARRLYQQGALAGREVNSAEVAYTQAQAQLRIDQQQLDKLRSVGQKADLQAAQGELQAAKGRYEGAQAQLGYAEVRSPIDGVVTDRPLYPGETASMTSPLAVVMDTSRVVARAHLPAAEAAGQKAGDAATISLPAGNRKFPATVTMVSPAVDPGDTTVQVWVEAPDPGGELKPGASVTVTITARTVPDALVVPKAAVISNSGQAPFVMTIGPDARAHRTDVQTGIEQDNRIQITHGLREGQLVVSEGAYGLPDGTKVKY